VEAPDVVILRRSDVSSLLAFPDVVEAVEEAFKMYAEGRSLEPGLLHIDSPPGEFHIKAGGLRLGRTFFALKVNGSFFENRASHGLPNIQGGIMLFDGDYGYPLALMDSIEITILRTGAAVAAAARHLARPDASVATICGCGNQGRMQLRALLHVLPISRVYAYDAFEDAAKRFARDVSQSLDVEATYEPSLGSAAAQSDVIVTCTPSKTPYLYDEYVKPGTFVAAVGADSADKQELEPRLLARSKVVVDLLEQCAHVGELHHALDAGLMTEQDVHGELGALLAGQVAGRASPDEITIFDATGTALQDTAAAVLAYERAMEAGVGLKVKLAG
jgi:alanine dehydrogenase